MPYCEGKNQAFVRFKYPDGDWQQVKSRRVPVDYSLEQTDQPFQGGQCYTHYFAEVGWYRPSKGWEYGIVRPTYGSGSFRGPIIRALICSNTGHVNTNTCGFSTVSSYGRRGRWRLFGYYMDGTIERTMYAEFGYINESSGPKAQARFVRWIRQDNQPDDCGNLPGGDCTFAVTDTGGTIFEKTAEVCPTVDVRCGEQCPPGTCECDRGSLVCCYDPRTGRVVKSFKR